MSNAKDFMRLDASDAVIAGQSCAKRNQIGFMKWTRDLPVDTLYSNPIWIWFRCFEVLPLLNYAAWELKNISIVHQPWVRDLYSLEDRPLFNLVGSQCPEIDSQYVVTLQLSISSGWVQHVYSCTEMNPSASTLFWFPTEPQNIPLMLYVPTSQWSILSSNAPALPLDPCDTVMSLGAPCSESRQRCAHAGTLLSWMCTNRIWSPSQNVVGCGNGMVGSHEECDDGNTESLDGCSSTCRVEVHATCRGAAPSVCSCQEGFRRTASGCTICDSDYYGPNCQPCPSWCASPRGVCNDGLTGTGECLCRRGFTGSECRDCVEGFHMMNEKCMGCSSWMCSPYGMCANGGESCECTVPGWSGKQCDIRTGHNNDTRIVICPAQDCGPHADCSLTPDVHRITNTLSMLPYYRCTCQLGWTGHRCQICQSGYVGPECEKCSACSLNSALSCVEWIPPVGVTPTSFGTKRIWKTQASGTWYVCPGDTFTNSSSSSPSPSESTTVTTDLDLTIVPNRRPLPNRVFSYVGEKTNTLCHRLDVSPRVRLIPGDNQVSPDICPHGIMYWVLDRALPADFVGIKRVLIVHRALTNWARAVPHDSTQTKIFIDGMGLENNDIESVLASSLSERVATSVMWLNTWFNGPFNIPSQVDDFQCGPSSSCDSLCLVTQVVANVSRVRLTNALCPTSCICDWKWPMHWTDVIPRLFQPASWSLAEPYAPGINRLIQNLAVMNTTQQYWKPVSRSAVSDADAAWFRKHHADQLFLDIWW